MNKVKLLIVDADFEFSKQLKTMFSKCQDIDLIGVTESAGDALLYIRRDNPDVVLFDMILPGMDGISFLRSMHMTNANLISICCTAFYSSVSIEAARRYGASYFLYKPIDFQSVYSAVINCYELGCAMRKARSSSHERTSDSSVLNLKIRNYIVSLGIPAKLIGCTYITEAVRLAKGDLSLTNNLSKGLYLQMSQNMNSTPGRIERCMRSAISIAYQKGSLRQQLISCPSNKEFINYVLFNIDYQS